MKETPKGYSARKLRIALERAKIAVMDAQEELGEFRGNTTTYQDLLDCSLRKLDAAWALATETEAAQRRRAERFAEA